MHEYVTSRTSAALFKGHIDLGKQAENNRKEWPQLLTASLPELMGAPLPLIRRRSPEDADAQALRAAVILDELDFPGWGVPDFRRPFPCARHAAFREHWESGMPRPRTLPCTAEIHWEAFEKWMSQQIVQSRVSVQLHQE